MLQQSVRAPASKWALLSDVAARGVAAGSRVTLDAFEDLHRQCMGHYQMALFPISSNGHFLNEQHSFEGMVL